MNTPYSEYSDHEVLRMAEHERSEAIAAFFRKLFTKRSEKSTTFTGDVVAAE